MFAGEGVGATLPDEDVKQLGDRPLALTSVVVSQRRFAAPPHSFRNRRYTRLVADIVVTALITHCRPWAGVFAAVIGTVTLAMLVNLVVKEGRGEMV
jgi:hypothetical protein